MALVTGGVMFAGTFLEKQYRTAPKGKNVGQKTISGFEKTGNLFGEWFAIAVVVGIMMVMVDVAPEFGGPFILLVLVAYLVTKGKYFGIALNDSQKS